MAPSPLRFGRYHVSIRVRLRGFRQRENGDQELQEQFVSGVTVRWRYPPKAFSLWTWPAGEDLFEGEHPVTGEKEEEFWKPYGDSWSNIQQDETAQTARAGVLTAYLKLDITEPGTVPQAGEWSALREIDVFVPDEADRDEDGKKYFANLARASPDHDWEPIWSAGPG